MVLRQESLCVCISGVRDRVPVVQHPVLRLDDVHALTRRGFALKPLALQFLGCKSPTYTSTDQPLIVRAHDYLRSW